MTEQSTEIADAEERNVSTNQASQLLRDIVAAARDPSIDGQKVTALANLAMTMQDREAERRFRMAKHDAIMEMPRISKNGSILNKAGGVQSRYSRFEDMDAVVRPILSKHRLIISFNVGHEGAMVTVQPILSYSDGEMAFVEKGDHMVLAVDTTGSKNATQGAGSAASYGKRHAMKAMLNIIEEGEDNDGQGEKVALSEDHRQLIDASREAARQGTAAYLEFFKGLTNEQRGFLAYTPGPNGKTFHEQNRASAEAFD